MVNFSVDWRSENHGTSSLNLIFCGAFLETFVLQSLVSYSLYKIKIKNFTQKNQFVFVPLYQWLKLTAN